MEIFPIPDKGDKRILVKKIKTILDKKEQYPDADVTALEHEIDVEVYRLYGLTTDEIAIIEAATHNAQKKAR